MKGPDRLAVGRLVATWWLPTVIACAVGALYVCYSVAQWRALVAPSWDLGIFAEAVQAYSRFEAPIVPIKGPGYNLLGDHFHPILALLGPIFRLSPSALTLLVVQDLLSAASPRTRRCPPRRSRLRPGVGAAGRGRRPVSRGLRGRSAAGFRRRRLRRAALGCVHGVAGPAGPCQGGSRADGLRRGTRDRLAPQRRGAFQCSVVDGVRSVRCRRVCVDGEGAAPGDEPGGHVGLLPRRLRHRRGHTDRRNHRRARNPLPVGHPDDALRQARDAPGSRGRCRPRGHRVALVRAGPPDARLALRGLR